MHSNTFTNMYVWWNPSNPQYNAGSFYTPTRCTSTLPSLLEDDGNSSEEICSISERFEANDDDEYVNENCNAGIAFDPPGDSDAWNALTAEIALSAYHFLFDDQSSSYQRPESISRVRSPAGREHLDRLQSGAESETWADDEYTSDDTDEGDDSDEAPSSMHIRPTCNIFDNSHGFGATKKRHICHIEGDSSDDAICPTSGYDTAPEA